MTPVYHYRGVVIRTTLRIPDELYARIREAATRERRSIHGQILALLERALMT
jgi:hypothetical protein